MTEAPSDPRPRWSPSPTLVGVLLAGLTLTVFWPAVSHGFINMDDDVYVTANPQVLGGLTGENIRWAFSGLAAGFWHPVTWLSLQLDATLWGRAAAGYHLTNILLHAANVVLVFLLLRRLTGSLWRSAVVALLFAVHPLRVEAVAWVSGRKELLAAFFGLLTLLAYVHFAQTAGPAPQQRRRWYGIALGFFALALLSKPMVVMLPVVLLLLDCWPLNRCPSENWRTTGWRLVREKLPFFGLSLAVGIVTLFGDFHVISRPGTVIPLVQHSLGLRWENAVVSYVRYLGEMLWPAKLAALYPYPAGYSMLAVAGAAGLLLVISLLVWRSGGPWARLGWSWYLLTLLPVIGILQVGPHSHADRYTYLPMIGVLVAVVGSASALLAERTRWHSGMLGLTGLLAVAWVAQAEVQLQYWRDSGSLFARTAAVTENNFSAYALCGNYLAGKGETAAAIDCFQRSLAINPNYADAWNNLGLAQAAQGQKDEAVADYRRALDINADHAGALNNLGAALAGAGKTDEAMQCYRRALDINPNQAATWNNLGYLLVGLGRVAEAVPCYEAAVRGQPDEPGFRMNLGEALMRTNHREEGLEQYREVLRQHPDLTEVRNFLKAQNALP